MDFDGDFNPSSGGGSCSVGRLHIVGLPEQIGLGRMSSEQLFGDSNGGGSASASHGCGCASVPPAIAAASAVGAASSPLLASRQTFNAPGGATVTRNAIVAVPKKTGVSPWWWALLSLAVILLVIYFISKQKTQCSCDKDCKDKCNCTSDIAGCRCACKQGNCVQVTST